MAGEWIKMRGGLRRNPKVIAMARYLQDKRAFMDWWSDPVHQTCSNSVTEIVTFSNVTRVTVAALLDVWSSLNDAIDEEFSAKCMLISDLDDIAEIPCFGDAMESVGWVQEIEDGGLQFPNFQEHNVIAKDRQAPLTNAERQQKHREKKKADCTEKAIVTKSNDSNGTLEKRRVEKNIKEIQCASSDARIDSKVVSDQFEEFWEAFDDKRGKKPALLRFKKVLKSGADFQAILAGAKRYAISRNQPDPPNPKMAEGWLNDERWNDEIVKPGQVASRPKETWQIENEVKTLKHQLEEIRNNSINKYAPDPERPWEQILKPEPKERADALKQKIKLLQSQMEVAA